jgi:hypoxanthine phosphoribosyltransferase
MAVTNQSTHPLYKQLIADTAAVSQRIEELATQTIDRYKGKDALFICLLRGGAPFASQLMFAITRQDPNFYPELDYLTIKTYGDERIDATAELVMDLSPSTKANGRLVVLLDDVLDKGITADFAQRHLVDVHQAAIVESIVLIQKNRKRTVYPEATMFGFEAPSDWLTGMGLDDSRIAKEANRWAGYVAIANEEL